LILVLKELKIISNSSGGERNGGII